MSKSSLPRASQARSLVDLYGGEAAHENAQRHTDNFLSR
jgi:hypothetical protein